MSEAIGKLTRVPLRTVWKHEAYDFTQWLQNNIDVLNSALDINLINVEREQAAGSFSIDLVAEDEGGGTVIIENQLEKSDHDHLGKVITYLTAMSARAAIWIVAEPRPEHVAAIAWLNEASSADFYLVKVEAVKIGESPAAPLLTVIVGPSEEAKSVGHSKKELAERFDIRHRWWERLFSLPEAKLHAHLRPGKYSHHSTSSGISGLDWNYTILQNECSAELYIDFGEDSHQENKRVFDKLMASKEEIESHLPRALIWDHVDGRRACKIRQIITGGYKSPEEDWPAIQAELVQAMNQLEQVLRPHLKQLKTKLKEEWIS